MKKHMPTPTVKFFLTISSYYYYWEVSLNSIVSPVVSEEQESAVTF